MAIEPSPSDKPFTRHIMGVGKNYLTDIARSTRRRLGMNITSLSSKEFQGRPWQIIPE